MAIGQMSAVTGRKIKPDYLTGIQAKSAYLPQAYQIDENKRIADANYKLAQDQYGLQKKQMDIANKINYANLGIGAAGALGSLLGSDDSVAQPVSKAVTSLPGVSDTLSGLGIGNPGAYGGDSGEIMGAVGDIASGAGGLLTDYVVDPAMQGLGWIDENVLGGVGSKIYDTAIDPVVDFAGQAWDAIF